MTIIYGWKITLSFTTLSFSTLFTSFLYNSVTICMISHKTSAGFLTAYFVAVYKWHTKPVLGKIKIYATVFWGIQKIFSKELLQRKKFKIGCLSALQILTDAWLLCRPSRNYKGSPEIGFWIFASLPMRYLFPSLILVSWSLTGMSVWGVERSHSKV